MTSSEPAGGARAADFRAHRIAIVLGLAAALAALYGAGWVYAAARFADGVRAFIAARQAQGIAVAYADIAIGGFPFRFEARLLAPSAMVALPSGTWIWRPDRAVFSARPWSLDRVALDLSGAHAIAPADASGLARWTFSSRAFALEAWISGADISALALRADGIRVHGRVAEKDITVGRLRADWRPAAAAPPDPRPDRGASSSARGDSPARPEHARPSQTFAWSVEAFRPPYAMRLPLGDEIARIAVAGEVRGRLAVEEGRDAFARWRDVFGRWRDDGGTIELSRVEGRWGALALAGEGTLALDGAFQPVGAFTARIEGYSETIDALRDAGAVSGTNAFAAKVVLTALARRDDGGRSYLTLPISLQERRLYVGPVALLTVPALAW
ncbi:MAG: DUF2125 domain-containing protein [Acidimicrobiia bacterium]|nr:DUF2125 domain-containing protein [Acidimicrobiia bacterium]